MQFTDGQLSSSMTSSISGSNFTPILLSLMIINVHIWTPTTYNNHMFNKENLLMSLHTNSDFSSTCHHLFGFLASKKSAKIPEKATSFWYIC
jgi:hypothetical protein